MSATRIDLTGWRVGRLTIVQAQRAPDAAALALVEDQHARTPMIEGPV
ncbi:MAG: hypothetical protein IMZ67_01930 [Acidobacteria bacterium]|nr:hypothetical protein [Acidobacteriota bacterium]